jgi:hypothetical protein
MNQIEAALFASQPLQCAPAYKHVGSLKYAALPCGIWEHGCDLRRASTLAAALALAHGAGSIAIAQPHPLRQLHRRVSVINSDYVTDASAGKHAAEEPVAAAEVESAQACELLLLLLKRAIANT